VNNTTIIDTFTLVDPKTGQSFTIPRGGDGTGGTPTNAAPTPNPVPQPAPAPQPAPVPQPAPQPAPGPSAEQQAIAKVNQGAKQCYPFPAPFEDGTSDVSTHPSSTPNSFVVQVVTHTNSGGIQTITWDVDRSTLAFTPTNDLAHLASDFCSALR
jgi:hypothetical protein